MGNIFNPIKKTFLHSIYTTLNPRTKLKILVLSVPDSIGSCPGRSSKTKDAGEEIFANRANSKLFQEGCKSTDLTCISKLDKDERPIKCVML